MAETHGIYRSVSCPACFAKAGEWCTVPTSTGRREVAWVHYQREHKFSDDQRERAYV